MQSNLKEIYSKLEKSYGKQGWWPVTEKGKFLPEYKFRKSLTEKQILEVCLGAFLTQNTNWDPNVVNSIINLNKENLINLEKLKRIDKKKLALLIQSSGYYNQKTENIKLFVKFLHENPIKKLEKLETGKLREVLLGLKGIGQETADSILVYAFNRPLFIVDAYTKRIFSRVGFFDDSEGYENVQKIFHNNLDKDSELFNEFHALIVEHAKKSCKKVPDCMGCCLNKVCSYQNK